MSDDHSNERVYLRVINKPDYLVSGKMRSTESCLDQLDADLQIRPYLSKELIPGYAL